jgi:anti-sigma-K factor RskA
MNGHPNREEDFDLFALGTLDREEREVIESHVVACSDCARKVAEARGRMALLAFAAPRVEPSPARKDSLMRQVRARAQDDARTHATPETGLLGRWWAAVLVPAGVVLTLATIFLWTENRRLDQELANLRTDMRQRQEQVQTARAVAELMAAPDTRVVALTPMPGMPKGAARVVYNARMRLLVYDGQLESAPAQKSYQLWLVPMSGQPISAGVFSSASGETNYWMIKLPQGITPIAFAVTLEPAGGRPQPTGPKVLVGPVS